MLTRLRSWAAQLVFRVVFAIALPQPLRPRHGDVLVIRVPRARLQDCAEGLLHTARRMRDGLRVRTGASVQVMVLADDVSLTTVSEDDMRRLGWERVR